MMRTKLALSLSVLLLRRGMPDSRMTQKGLLMNNNNNVSNRATRPGVFNNSLSDVVFIKPPLSPGHSRRGRGDLVKNRSYRFGEDWCITNSGL